MNGNDAMQRFRRALAECLIAASSPPQTEIPTVHSPFQSDPDQGSLTLTIRDQFAVAALSGVVDIVPAQPDPDSYPAAVAELAYAIADAMLARRTHS
jgi:hypothetical protein